MTWTRRTPGEVRYLQDVWLPVSEHQPDEELHHQVPADSVAAVGDEVHCQLFSILLLQ